MGAESELKALRAEVRRLGDIEAVKKLTAEYMQAMHDARWDDAVACFSDHASYDHGLLGQLMDKAAIRRFYTEFMPQYEEAGGWAFDMLTNPVIRVDGDRAEGRWFLFTLLVDPDTKEAAWNVATLEYTYAREEDGWKFLSNRCISEHQSVPYATGWGMSGRSRVTSFTKAEATATPMNFDLVRAQGGKQKPGRLTRSIRGWTVPTLEPES
jgi:hypothetical protein